ncbi:C-type lectin domain family 5 member A [Monodelphis domestica]|uniref:C-type lectin domain containing 5A n=1 Tax=Monodelphis domestica TaxID=13616 RepID=A0A5F8GF82_MONDO|nr:C-type lectin domain family 5 member A [Monodelphis domestica]
MAFINCHMILSVVIVVTIKVTGTTFFLLYLPQIFPPVLERSLNSTSTEKSITAPSISPTTFEGTFNSTIKNNITVCPIRWEYEKGKCYFFSTNEENWNKSQSSCLKEGATLAIINNSGEQNFLQNRAGVEPYFIGLRYNFSQRKWRWIDGSEDFVVTMSIDPPGFGCGTIGVSINVEDSSCDISHRWICEKIAP